MILTQILPAMSETVRFRKITKKLPCRIAEFSINNTVAGYRIISIISVEQQKTVFQLDRDAVLCVRHNGYHLPEDLLTSLQANTPGLVQVLAVGTIQDNWYTIDRQLQPLPSWNSLDSTQRKHIFSKMVKAVNALHDLGYCHNDIKPEHFGIDQNGDVRLIDFDSSIRFFGKTTKHDHIEYTEAYASPEMFFSQFSTASDYYSLARSVLDWGHLQDAQLTGWLKVLTGMCSSEVDLRYNYTQINQVLNDLHAERATGPRTYKTGVIIGRHTAYSRKQTALYLTESYDAAVDYCRRNNKINGSPAASVARVIHSLDSTLPLFWYGEPLDSSASIGREMSSDYPQMNKRMTELLQSGILLEFNQFNTVDGALKNALKGAIQDPAAYYWHISRCFGGRSPTPERLNVQVGNVAQKRAEFKRLIRNVLEYGDPVVVASILHGQAPRDDQLDAMIARLRAVPLRDIKNLTNIQPDHPFHSYIETRLPEPGSIRIKNNPNISELFPVDRKYIIADNSFSTWKETHQNIKTARKRRTKSVFKALGWTSLSAAIVAALPFVIAGLLIVGAIILVLALLFG